MRIPEEWSSIELTLRDRTRLTGHLAHFLPFADHAPKPPQGDPVLAPSQYYEWRSGSPFARNKISCT
jgi:hypothetical protein